jgi:peptide/nickel transport system permease protein
MADTELALAGATAPEVVADEQHDGLHRTGRLTLIVRRFARRPSALIGTFLLLFLILFAIFGPLIANWGYDEPDFLALAQPPSAEHWFGTTTGGSDVFALVARGLSRSLLIGVLSSLAITFVAAVLGTAIAFFEGWIERVGMWVLDTLLVVPSFLLIAMITRSASGTGGWLVLTLALTAFGWIGYARVLRTLTLSLRELDYVHAARYMGVGAFTIIRRHLIPNLGSVLIIQTVLGVVGAVNSETALSFLGLGVKAPDVSLGTILQAGQSVVLTSPWVLLAPSIFLVALTFSMQLIGDGLRDAIDPYSRSGGKA